MNTALPLIDRRYAAPAPASDVEFHIAGCECPHCADAAPLADDRLGFVELGNLALAAIVVGSIVAFAIDPAGAWAALVDVVRSFAS